MCAARGQESLAEVVDHIIPHRGDPKLFWDRNNWQGLCKHDHDAVKQSQERGGAGIAKDMDADGMPIDPRHHWNA